MPPLSQKSLLDVFRRPLDLYAVALSFSFHQHMHPISTSFMINVFSRFLCCFSSSICPQVFSILFLFFCLFSSSLFRSHARPRVSRNVSAAAFRLIRLSPFHIDVHPSIVTCLYSWIGSDRQLPGLSGPIETLSVYLLAFHLATTFVCQSAYQGSIRVITLTLNQ